MGWGERTACSDGLYPVQRHSLDILVRLSTPSLCLSSFRTVLVSGWLLPFFSEVALRGREERLLYLHRVVHARPGRQRALRVEERDMMLCCMCSVDNDAACEVHVCGAEQSRLFLSLLWCQRRVKSVETHSLRAVGALVLAT